MSGRGRCQAEEGRTSGGRVERPADSQTSGGRNGYGGECPPYKGGYIKGVRRTYKDAEGLALLRPRAYLSADQSSNVPRLTKLYSCGRIRNPVEPLNIYH